MSDETPPIRDAADQKSSPLAGLRARGQAPNSARVNLTAWIEAAARETSIAHNRLAWLVASTVVVRHKVEVINTPTRVIKPRRFDITVELKGTVCRRMQVEIAADEGGAGNEHDELAPPPLRFFGLDTPDTMFGIALRYQVSQKLHACTDPHDPPTEVNDRAAEDAGITVQITEARALINEWIREIDCAP